MDVNNSLPSRFKVGKSISTPAGRADAARSRASSGTEQSKMPELKEGQLIRGQIIDHRYNEVKIQVEPGNQVITARLAGDNPLSIGQEASFIVSEAGTGELVLKLLPSEDSASANESVIIKALTAAGITINDRSKAIVAELLNQRMSIDRNTLQTLIRLAASHRNASPLCLVLMYKNNIPINAKNLQQFQAYLEGTHQLLYKIKDISTNISKLLMTGQNSSHDISLAASADSHMPAGDLLTPAGGLTSAEQSINISSEGDSLLNAAQAQEMTATEANLPMLSNSSLAGTDHLQGNLLQNALAVNSRLIDIFLSTAGEKAQSQTASAAQEMAAGITPSDIQGQGNELPAKAASSAGATGLAEIMDDGETALLLKQLSDAPDINGIKERIANKTATVAEFLSYIKSSMSSMEAGQAISLLTSAEYTRLLEKAFFKKWTIASDSISQKQSVKDFYKQLEADLKEINRLISSLAEGDDKAALHEPVDDMQSNLQFMKDLNNAFAFIQLPVDFKDRQFHTDLYVMSRKRALNDKNQSLTVHLYLETANLGKLNIHLKMTDKLVETIFYPADNGAAAIIRDNLPHFIETLQGKGYIATANVSEKPGEADAFKRLLEQDIQDGVITRYSFDIRT